MSKPSTKKAIKARRRRKDYEKRRNINNDKVKRMIGTGKVEALLPFPKRRKHRKPKAD
jgi:hypothetical protein